MQSHRLRVNYGKIVEMFRFIDLFAGIGGFHLAAQALGGECVMAVVWDKYSQKSCFANFGQQPAGDITQISADTIPDHDSLFAGFPCHPFSIAGVSKHNSLGVPHGFAHPTQGTLFFDGVRILREKRPKPFILENVRNLVSPDRGRTFKVILETLRSELGYTVKNDAVT